MGKHATFDGTLSRVANVANVAVVAWSHTEGFLPSRRSTFSQTGDHSSYETLVLC